MTKLPSGVIINRSALKFLKRIIKTRKEGYHLSAETVSNQPWVAELFDNESECSRKLGLIARGQYEIHQETLAPKHRVSGVKNLKGNQPPPKIKVFTLISTGGDNEGLRLEINFKTDGRYLTFWYMC